MWNTVLSQSFADRLWCGLNEKWWIMGRSRDQFGPEGPEVSTSAACRSQAVRDQAKGRRAAGDPNLKLGKPRTKPIVRRLRAGGNRIRTIGTAPAKGSSGLANRRRRHERRSDLQVQVRNGNACLEWLPIAFPFAERPRVRIRLPPAASLQNAAKRLDTGKSPPALRRIKIF